MNRCLSQSQLETIAAALADTTKAMTGSEIGHPLRTCGSSDPTPTTTKRHRLYNEFAECQNSRQDRRAILAIIRNAMNPERYARCPQLLEPMRKNLNRVLSFAGDDRGIC